MSPLGFKTRKVALFTLGGGIHVTHSLRFNSGTIPADLLMASMAAELFYIPGEQALVGIETGIYHATTHNVRPGRQMLY